MDFPRRPSDVYKIEKSRFLGLGLRKLISNVNENHDGVSKWIHNFVKQITKLTGWKEVLFRN